MSDEQLLAQVREDLAQTRERIREIRGEMKRALDFDNPEGIRMWIDEYEEMVGHAEDLADQLKHGIPDRF